MTDDRKTEQLRSRSANDEQTIEKLIRLGGQREEIDPACTARVRETVYQTWLAKNRQRSDLARNKSIKDRLPTRHMRIRLLWSGLAASLLLGAVTIITLSQRPNEAPTVVATVKVLQGTVTGDGRLLAQGAELRTGQEIQSGSIGGLAIILTNGALVKLDRLTKVRFTSQQDLELKSGGVYFDSQGNGDIRVHTTRGVIQDIGTQFETRLAQNELLVRVREGKVKVDQAETAVFVASGQALQLADGAARVTEIAVGGQWLWADALDENFSVADRPMAEILAWLCHRENWILQYHNETDQQRAQADIIRGRLNIGDGKEMLRQLSLISDMQFHFDDRVLVIRYSK